MMSHGGMGGCMSHGAWGADSQDVEVDGARLYAVFGEEAQCCRHLAPRTGCQRAARLPTLAARGKQGPIREARGR